MLAGTFTRQQSMTIIIPAAREKFYLCVKHSWMPIRAGPTPVPSQSRSFGSSNKHKTDGIVNPARRQGSFECVALKTIQTRTHERARARCAVLCCTTEQANNAQRTGSNPLQPATFGNFHSPPRPDSALARSGVSTKGRVEGRE